MRYPLPLSRCVSPAPLHPQGRRPGFALIIVLTLMAFLVLLFVTLTVSIQVAAQVSENNIQTTQARLNALYGVNVAIAQLQKFAGRDQSVTGTADLGVANTSTTLGVQYPPAPFLARNDTSNTGVYAPAGIGGTTYWTGVWGNPNPPSSIYTGNQIAGVAATGSNTTAPTPVLLNWLVSGNENTTLYVTVDSTTNQIRIGNTSAALMPYTPNVTVTLSNNTAFNANVTANSQLILKTPTVANVTSVLLMGPNSAGNSSVTQLINGTTVTQNATTRYVVAPLVPLYTPDVSGTSTVSAVTGNYAYWVSDEGVKAKYNMVDAYNGTGNTSALIGAANYTSSKVSGNLTTVNNFLYRLMVPQRYAIEEMGNLTTYPANNSTLKNIIEPLQAHYVATSDSDPIAADTLLNNDPLRLHTHDFTTYSYGVLSDSLHGGLKYDLTTAFEMPAIFNGTGSGGNTTYSLAGRNILPDGVNNGANSTVAKTDPNYDAGATVISPLAGLKWDKLYNYYNIASTVTNPALGTTSVPIQPGVVPIVVGGRLQFGAFLTNPTSGPGAETAFGTWAAFVLANPYNYTITGNIDLHYTINTHTKSEWGIGMRVRNGTGITTPIFYDHNDQKALALWQPTGFIQYFPILKNSLDFAANVSGPSILDPVYFHIANLSLLPGQATIYALSSTSVGLPAPYATPAVEKAINSTGTNTTFICMNTNSGLPNANVSLAMGPVGGGGPSGSVVGSLESFFLTHTAQGNGTVTGADIPSDTGRLWLGAPYPSVACTLQIFANTTAGSPGVGGTLVQSIMGMDLTGGNVGGTPAVSFLMTNQGNFQIYPGTSAPPHFLGGYYFWLGMPDTFTVNVNAGINNYGAYNLPDIQTSGLPFMDMSVNSTLSVGGKQLVGQNYRTYADFNLRASNITVPPNSGFLALNQIDDQSDITNTANNQIFPTVPPYIRLFDESAGFATLGLIYANDTLFHKAGSMGVLSSGTIYNGTWGHMNGNATSVSGGNQGETNVVLYALPWRALANAKTNDLPMLSMGQFQHADLTADDIYSSVSYQPGNAFGNSLYTPFVHRAQSIQPLTNNQTTVLSGLTAAQLGGNYTLGPGATAGTVNAYDISYLVNAALWDHYYFSGVAQGVSSTSQLAVPGSSTPNTVVGQMSNPRMKFATGFSPNNTILNIGTATLNSRGAEDLETSNATVINYIPQPYVLSRYLVNDGAFNVNSTSVEAWKAVLASLRGVNPGQTVGSSASNLTSTIITSSITGAPSGTTPVVAFPRVLPGLPMITTASISSNYTNQKTNLGDNNASFVGYRSLSDTDISNLASMIVQQVRARGPFLSLAQFVNRSLTAANDPRSKDGAIQASIDALQGGSFNTMTDLSNNTTLAKDAVTFMSPYPNFDTSANDTLYRSTNIPGWMTQADILQAIAPVLTTRSDTFVIRAYGQVDNPLDGSVQSRAWCEAIVQREPEYVDTVTQNSGTNLPDNPAVMPWLANPANNFFGRRMRLISLHWLNPSDI